VSRRTCPQVVRCHHQARAHRVDGRKQKQRPTPSLPHTHTPIPCRVRRSWPPSRWGIRSRARARAASCYAPHTRAPIPCVARRSWPPSRWCIRSRARARAASCHAPPHTRAHPLRCPQVVATIKVVQTEQGASKSSIVYAACPEPKDNRTCQKKLSMHDNGQWSCANCGVVGWAGRGWAGRGQPQWVMFEGQSTCHAGSEQPQWVMFEGRSTRHKRAPLPRACSPPFHYGPALTLAVHHCP